MSSPLLHLARSRRSGAPAGIYSVCSAHPWVIEAAMRQALGDSEPLLIEATVNQVNHLGGYTGRTPSEFRDEVLAIAEICGFPAERVLLGGDHLGPFPWRDLPPGEAMRLAEETVAEYVRAGFRKIHLDASMPLPGDSLPLDVEIVAARAARLCAAAEQAGHGAGLVYVIGTEVPTPGGATEELHDLQVTSAAAAEETLRAHERAFAAAGLEDAFRRVIALVVQPGVEFGNENVVNYEPAKARHLAAFLAAHPDLSFEAHSTDYQPASCYRSLVEDGFAVLKIGPQLTFAMRETLLALEQIECILAPDAELSRLSHHLELAMLADPSHWKQHYHGSEAEQKVLRLFSYSDRVRYFWGVPEVGAAVERLMSNLRPLKIPETLLSQYLPLDYIDLREGVAGAGKPRSCLFAAIQRVLVPLRIACGRREAIGSDSPGLA